MNSVIFSATRSPASNKIECFSLGRISSFELDKAPSINRFKRGLQPPSFSPVNTRVGASILCSHGAISVPAYIRNTLRKAWALVAITWCNLSLTTSGLSAMNWDVNHRVVNVSSTCGMPFFSIECTTLQTLALSSSVRNAAVESMPNDLTRSGYFRA